MDSEVRGCLLQIGNTTTIVDLRVMPLGSYGIVLALCPQSQDGLSPEKGQVRG